MESNGKKVLWVLVVVILIVAGFYFGQSTGVKKTEQKLEPIVNLAFPKPSSDIRNFSGTIKNVVGATINLEIRDPNDYLPHTDGTKPKTQIRFVNVTATTKILLIDATKRDKSGNPTITNLKLTDLKAGDWITARSNQNVSDAQKFDATEIDLLKS
ncbi:MAG: hypothetical protein AAB432_01855 [Patescibacteria group bacterium]